MKKNIYITESQLQIIREFENKEVLYKDFEDNLRTYLEELKKNPCKPKYNDFFQKNDIPEKELLGKMVDLGLISRKDNITEPIGGDGKKQSMHTRSYKFFGENFDEKVDKLYKTFFDDGERIIKECDCGGVMGGGGTCGIDVTPGGATSTPVVGDTDTKYEFDVPYGVYRRGVVVGSKKKKKDPSFERKKGGVAISNK